MAPIVLVQLAESEKMSLERQMLLNDAKKKHKRVRKTRGHSLRDKLLLARTIKMISRAEQEDRQTATETSVNPTNHEHEDKECCRRRKKRWSKHKVASCRKVTGTFKRQNKAAGSTHVTPTPWHTPVAASPETSAFSSWIEHLDEYVAPDIFWLQQGGDVLHGVDCQGVMGQQETADRSNSKKVTDNSSSNQQTPDFTSWNDVFGEVSLDSEIYNSNDSDWLATFEEHWL